MKRLTIILLVMGSGCITTANGQELSYRKTPNTASEAVPMQQQTLALPALQWPSENTSSAAEQVAQSVFLKQNRKSLRRQERELSRNAQLWRTTLGNTSMNNWSPYPDRALDARTLSFPLPKKP